MKRINSADRRALRVTLCNRASGRCQYCNLKVGMRGTVDHYLPQALGGTNARENLRWACVGCNNLKADMPPEEWEQRKPLPVQDAPTKAEIRARMHRLIVDRARGQNLNQRVRRHP